MITPVEAQRVAQAAIFREWAGLIEAGLATREILRHWHTRLTVGAEFAPGVDLEQMRLLVDDRLGVDQADLFPDYPPEGEPPAPREGREW